MYMKPSETLSSVERIYEAISGFSVYFFYVVEPGAYQCTSDVFAILKSEGKQVYWVGGGWFYDTKPVEDAVLSQEEFFQIVTTFPSKDVCVVFGSQADHSNTQKGIEFCKQQNMFTLFLFDHWCNLELHFLDQENKVLHLPHRIGVVDAFEQEALWNALRPYNPPNGYRNNIVVTGQPSIESMVQKIQRVTPQSIQAFRREINAVDRKVQLYLMEPNCVDFGLDVWDRNYLGYTEYTVLDLVLKEKRDNDDVLLIRPHPRQRMDVFHSFFDGYSNNLKRDCIVATKHPLELLIASADAIYGMTTVVLIMALKAGKTVVSLQPNRTARGKKMSNIYIEQYLEKTDNSGEPI